MTSVTSSNIRKRVTVGGLAGLAVLACALAFGASQAQSAPIAGSAVAEPPIAPPQSAPQRAALAPVDPADALIAFTRNSPAGQYHIWTMHSDGTQQVDLTAAGLSGGAVEDFAAAWSPDGTRIAFQRNAAFVSGPGVSQPNAAAPVADRDIWVMNADGTGQVNLSAQLRDDPAIGASDAYTPAWSADGTKIAFSIQTLIVVFDVANPVSHYIIRPPTNSLNAIEPSFKPDGTKIVYSATVTNYAQGDIVEANVDGTGARLLTQDVTTPGQERVWNDTSPSYSPDGSAIAFTRQQRVPDLNGRITTAVIDAQGLRTIDPATERTEFNPSWSPDGSKLAIQAAEPGSVIKLDGDESVPNAKLAAAPPGQSDIWTYNANGTGAVNLTSSAEFEGLPAWAPVANAQPSADLVLYKSTSLDPVIVDVAPKAKKTTAAQLKKAQQKDARLKKAQIGTSAIPDVEPGDEFTYYLDVYNNGPRTATNVSVSDPLPAEMEFVSATSPACTGTTTVTCTTASLASGFSIRFQVTVRVRTDAKTGDVTNTATVSSGTQDPNAGNNSGSATVHVIADADVEMFKFAFVGEGAPVETAEPGDGFAYLLRVTNNGPATARHVVVTDTLPDQVEFSSFSDSDAPCSISGATITCDFGDLESGKETGEIVLVRVKDDARGDAVNTANVTTTSTDPTPGNNSDTSTVRIISDTDVQIFKSTNLGGGDDVSTLKSHQARLAAQEDDEVEPGQEFTYFIDVFNAGPATARDITVTDTLPDGVELDDNDSNCTAQGQQITCHRDTLDANTWWYIDIEVEVVAKCGEIVNTARVTSRTPDPNLDNNSSTSTVHIICADLTVDIADAPDPVLLGDQVTYTVAVINHGTDTAVDTVLTDTLPADVDLVSITPAAGCTPAGQTITCELGDLPANETRTFTIVVLPRNPGEIVNTARAVSETDDPDEENNTDTETTLVRGTDIAVTVTDDPDPVPYAEVLTYTITVTNNGPQTAQVEVVDTLPSAVRVETIPANCTVNGRVIRCQLGAMEPETTTTLEIAVRPFVVGDIVNRTQVLLDIPDSDPESNRVDTTTTVRGTGLSIQATAKPEPVDGNQPLTYEVVAANSGPAAAADAVVVISWNNPPPAATIESSTPCTVANRQLRCELGTIAAGDSVTFTVTVVPNRAGDLITTLDALTSVPDENPDDNQVVLTTTVRPADLVLTQQIAPRPGFVGGVVTYTLRITNTGTAIARDVTVIHRIPAGPQVGAVTPSAGTCVVAPVLRCELGDLAPGAAPVTIVVKVRPVSPATIVTSALATTSTTEPDLTDNEVRAATPVRQPRLELPKVGSPGFTALVVGRDFPANTDITLRWDKGLNPAAGTTVRTDANGVFRFRMLVFPRDQIGQRVAIAAGPVDSFADVTAPHLVVPNPVAPRRFISRR